jgi:protein-tyrosine phosphatase
MGNICRSPTAHGVFLKLLEEEGLADCVDVDSAGTHAYHVQEPPDRRAQEAALRRNVNLSSLRARKAISEDFIEFDYIIAMDESNYADLAAIAPKEHQQKLKMFLDYAPQLQIREVPDPYYGGQNGFERVLDMVEVASKGLLETLKKNHQL